MPTLPNNQPKKAGPWRSLARLIAEDRGRLGLAFLALVVGSILNLATPFLFGYAVDHYVRLGEYPGVLRIAAALLAGYVIALGTNYAQMRLMGGVGQSVLFRLRNAVFTKLQDLPVAFFQTHRAGDLISRVNNDTDKLNQFFSETLVRFMGSLFMIAGAAAFLLAIDVRLGLAALAPAAGLLVFTRLASPWVKAKNGEGLKALGGLSAGLQESLETFKVVVAFDRRDYFRRRLQDANERTFKAARTAGFANGALAPTYDLAANLALLTVIGYGLALIGRGLFTFGFLLSFLMYVERLYAPLRQIAMLWSSLQLALAGWDRVSEILEDPARLATATDGAAADGADALLAFDDVSFSYPDGKKVLHGLTLRLEPGKTYALVGPTGGGKTTTASLMARLYDPTAGAVSFRGRDLRTFTPEERAARIGFILQEPFLFGGTVLENVFYGHPDAKLPAETLRGRVRAAGLGELLERLESGAGENDAVAANLSLGQRQLVAFLRAVLREPELLILDEATANIDTVTEQLLEKALRALPKTTTKVVIAHRLNTIADADEIFFVNEGRVTPAGSLEHAMEMLTQGKRAS